MFQFLRRRKRKNPATVGVAFGPDGFALARVHAGNHDAAPHVDAPGWFPATDAATLARRLEDCVSERDFTRHQAVGVLAPGDYQVLQVEAPNVPAAEMNQAAAWRVRDLVDMPLDQAVIDTFQPPESAQRGERQINVVVARRSVVEERVQMLKDAGMDLVAIDIPELVQRNICLRLAEARGGHALLALDDHDGLLTVFRDGELFLARSLDTGLNALAAGDDESVDALLLEVQRSFDYFESALSQPPLGALYIYPPAADPERVAAAVTEGLSGVDCRCVGLADIASVDGTLDPDAERAPALHAVGAALREREVAPA